MLASTPFAVAAQETAIATNDSGDSAWILTASALVLMMTLPGLGLFYGGLVRAKNVLSVLLQCGAIAALASVLWVVVGYTLAFGQVSGGWLGAGNAWMLIDLGDLRLGTSMPESTFVLFQMTFAIITPALMVGAWVDRARFGWVLGFSALWGLVVYAPVAHWVWGGGWLASQFGVLDFAGGITVHTTAGVSALVIALLLGKRDGFPIRLMLPHAPVLTMIGAAMLWVGWFGFNGGSAFAATDDASAAIINTHVAASSAALVWLLVERFTVGRPTSIGWATGAIAGLATVTPAAGFISPGAAILFGAAAGVICYAAIQLVKFRLKIDDSLDVFAVHGIGGMLGTMLLGAFLSPSFGGTGYAEGMSMGTQLGSQAFAIAVVAVYSAIASAILALMVSLLFPMRVSKDEETEGLDITSHGERGWEMD
ncbi:ammonium transporter [Altererythrobacter arenosus]|uniref:Ammonium transporter n=2 Tax=Altererythrobacter arenosus TaxID=3032592 RepID=A0ABY8FVR0_9SPHN|nr:ammonium transporter [Altererythrobacter sp. CAU 1644]WFL79092.1 ammonium transporter [Altererythrobacter sp. CAU 1644]